MAHLSRHAQKEIAERITAGANPKSVIKEYATTRDGRHCNTSAAFGKSMRTLKRAVNDLGDRLDSVRDAWLAEHLENLQQAKTLIVTLINRGKRAKRQGKSGHDVRDVAAAITHDLPTNSRPTKPVTQVEEEPFDFVLKD
jgi:hypothetical protein